MLVPSLGLLIPPGSVALSAMVQHQLSNDTYVDNKAICDRANTVSNNSIKTDHRRVSRGKHATNGIYRRDDAAWTAPGTSATTPGTAALVEASTFLSGVSTKEGNGVSGVSTKEGNGVYSDEASGKGPKLLKVPGGCQATPTYRASHSL